MAYPPPPQPNDFEKVFINTSQSSFNTVPYYWQYFLGGGLLKAYANNTSITQLCVRPTGGGKSLLYQVTAACLKQVTLVVTPLLALGSDQLDKGLAIPDVSITAFHLDDLDPNKIEQVLTKIKNCEPDETIILLSSPQCIVGIASSLISHIILSKQLRMIMMDELHLSHHFGRSFRSEFSKLKPALFSKVSSPVQILLLTATCSQRILEASEQLFGFEVTDRYWPSVYFMANRTQALLSSYTPRSRKPLHTSISRILKDTSSLPNKIIVYGNTRNNTLLHCTDLKAFMDKDEVTRFHDVIHIHGEMPKIQKSSHIYHFVNDRDPLCDFKVLVATSGVGNAGIDSKEVRAVFRIDLPPSIFDLTQEMGRAGRTPFASPSEYKYQIYYKLEDVLYLFGRIYDNSDGGSLDESYKEEQVRDLVDVISLLANPKVWHKVLVEEKLGDPRKPQTPFPICHVCTACTQSSSFPSICKQGTQLFFFDVFTGSQGGIQGIPTHVNVVNAIRCYPGARRHLLSINSDREPAPMDIRKILFLLIGVKIVHLSNRKTEEGRHTTFHLTKTSEVSTTFCLMEDFCWQNINLKHPIPGLYVNT
jgi:superfamily II DNA helicase RecQ